MTRDTLTMVLACLAAALIVGVVGYGALKDAAATIKASRRDVEKPWTDDTEAAIVQAVAIPNRRELAYDVLDEIARRREQARRV